MQPLIDFYKEKRRSLVRLASKRVGPDWAEDAVHDAFENAIRYYSTYNPHISDIGTWFGTILNKACYNTRRANMGGKLTELHECDWVITEKPDNEYFLNEILSKINGYSVHHRQVLYCAFVMQYKYEQIARITGLGIRNVSTIKERFCTDMRERYGDCSST